MTTSNRNSTSRRLGGPITELLAVLAIAVLALVACAPTSTTPDSMSGTTLTMPGSSGLDSFPIAQEIIYFSAPGGVLSSRTERIPYRRGSSPDAEVRAHLGWDGSQPPSGLVHSTSWHFDEASGELVLTWAVTPDPQPQLDVTAVDQKPVAQGADAAHPVPTGLGDQAVITHAARHLAFLMATDPEVDAALRQQPMLHEALRAFAPALAGNPATAS